MGAVAGSPWTAPNNLEHPDTRARSSPFTCTAASPGSGLDYWRLINPQYAEHVEGAQ